MTTKQAEKYALNNSMLPDNEDSFIQSREKSAKLEWNCTLQTYFLKIFPNTII